MMIYLLTLFTFSESNRLAGSIDLLGKLIYGLAVFSACSLLGFDPANSAVSGALAFAGRQYISHGKVYQLADPEFVRDAGPWWSICFARSAMIFMPVAGTMTTLLIASVAAATACLATNKFARYLEDRRYVSDMLAIAERLQGFFVAAVLCAIAHFAAGG